MTFSSNRIEHDALSLAARGFFIFPCAENKIPTCPHGFKDASADPAIVTALWHQYPAPLIGVATGAISGLDVLDIDPRHGGGKWLATHEANILPTRIHQTRSGGWHYIFKHHPGLRNSAGKIAPGVDVRADGGYVIWWPACGLPVPNDMPIAPWPEWLLQILTPPPKLRPAVPRTDFKGGSTYANAALRHAIQAVACAGEGTRNETLNREAFSLARFISTGDLPVQVIAKALATAALAAGLTSREITATLTSALRARGNA